MNQESSDAAKKLIEDLQNPSRSARIGNFPFRSESGQPLLQLSLQFTPESILFRLISPSDLDADVEIPDELAKALIALARLYLHTNKSSEEESPELYFLPSRVSPSSPSPDDLPDCFRDLVSKALSLEYKLAPFTPHPELFLEEERTAWISAEIRPARGGCGHLALVNVVSNSGETCRHPVMEIIIRLITNMIFPDILNQGLNLNSRLVFNFKPVPKE